MYGIIYVTQNNTVKYCGSLTGIAISEFGGASTYQFKQIPNLNNVNRVFCDDDGKNIYFLMNDCTVKCLGINENGELGLGHTNRVTSITNIPINNVKDITIGYNCVYFLLNDGTVKACGYRYASNLIDILIKDVRIIRADMYYTSVFYILNNGDIYCDGSNSYGELGFYDTRNGVYLKKLVNGGYEKDIVDIKMCNLRTFVLYKNGDVRFCGDGEDQYSGLGMNVSGVDYRTTTINQNFIVDRNVDRIYVSYSNIHLLEKTNMGRIVCSGTGFYNELGGYKKISWLTQFPYDHTKKIINCFGDSKHFYILFEDMSIIGCGESDGGAMGLPTQYDSNNWSTPYNRVQIPINDLKSFVNTDVIEINKFLISTNGKDLLYPNINTNTLDNITTKDNFDFSKTDIDNSSVTTIYNTYSKINKTSSLPFKIYMSKKIY